MRRFSAFSKAAPSEDTLLPIPGFNLDRIIEEAHEIAVARGRIVQFVFSESLRVRVGPRSNPKQLYKACELVLGGPYRRGGATVGP